MPTTPTRFFSIPVIAMLLWPLCSLAGGPPPELPSGELERAVERLGVVANVLYVAAHPDDENTRLLGYLAREKLWRTAYLSVTRGDGGQNLIGPEQGPLLGLIRTEELLAARRIDGAEQLFTRARDFGYSKTAEETLAIWDRDMIVGDMVTIIRRFHPDLIITRFPQGGVQTHGHHLSSAILAAQAFSAAADPKFHPEEVAALGTWQAKRLLWNAWSRIPPAGAPAQPAQNDHQRVRMDIGIYNPFLGVSYGELAAKSRSMHKSQGFGSPPQRGPVSETFELLEGAPISARGSIFEGIDATWARVPKSERLQKLLDQARQKFRPSTPWTILPILQEAAAALAALPQNPWKADKQRELDETIAACAGLFAEVYAADYSVSPGQMLKLTASVVSRAPVTLTWRGLAFSGQPPIALDKPLQSGQPVDHQHTLTVPVDAPYSTPYWLREPPGPGRYPTPDPAFIGMPEGPPPLAAELTLALGNHLLHLRRPVLYKWTDDVAGERYRDLEISPEVTVTPAAQILVFSDPKPRELELVLTAHQMDAQGTVRLTLPPAWHAEPAAQPFTLGTKASETRVRFRLTPPAPGPAQAGPETLGIQVETFGKTLSQSFLRIEYPHIPIRTLYPKAEVKLVRFDLKKARTRIGYVLGAGDDVAACLRQVGYSVTLLDVKQLGTEPLERFDTLVVGVRAYNIHERLDHLHQKLMDYVKAGGTLLVQYNTRDRIADDPMAMDIGPYPFNISHDRVTEEDAQVTFALPEHPALHTPNPLGPADFMGWVQERGLYFADRFDEHYQTPLVMNDHGEMPKKGSLLIARHGKGVFIYTGLSFFRQLPAGVPGAYRLLANLIAYGQ